MPSCETGNKLAPAHNKHRFSRPCACLGACSLRAPANRLLLIRWPIIISEINSSDDEVIAANVVVVVVVVASPAPALVWFCFENYS